MARNVPRALTLGMALALLSALACLGFAALRDGRLLSPGELSRSRAPLMSCAAEPASSHGELLWCADPSSPQCIPAAPEVPRVHLADRPELLPIASDVLAKRPYVLLPWPRAEQATLLARDVSGRLERPPRA